MRILEKIMIGEKEYICIQKLSIDNKIAYMCVNVQENEFILLQENENAILEKIENEQTIEKANKLIYAKSPDVI